MELPDSHYVGQEYIEDKEILPVMISWDFYSPAVLDSFPITVPGIKGEAISNGNFLEVKLQKNISRALFQDTWKKRKNIRQYYIGYINQVMPFINVIISQQKYLSRHLLATQFSVLDVRNIKVVNLSNGHRVDVEWPVSVTICSIPEQLAIQNDEIYIRDLIDACTYYFTFNTDDCIRRIITSLENYSHANALEGSFRSRLNQIIVPEAYIADWAEYLEILKNNISFIYDLRNAIVHNKFRLEPSKRFICNKGIGTMLYIYQNNKFSSPETIEYVYSIMMQYLLLEDLCSGIDLEMVASGRLSSGEIEGNRVLDSPQALNAFMFKGLEISNDEKDFFDSSQYNS